MKIHPVTLALVIGCAIFASCKVEPRTEYVLGTVCTVNLYDKGTKAIYDELFARLRELESILSANNDTSNIAEINAAAGITPVKAKPDTLTVLTTALEYCEPTNGEFDPSVGPLVKAWNIGSDNAAVPSKEVLQKAMSLVDYRNIEVDQTAGTVFLKKQGMKLDLGAIAKGYAADGMAKIIKRHGIQKAMIDLGGNILAIGEKAPNTPWTIGIRDPEQKTGSAILSLKVKDMSIVTSGTYERYFVQDGKSYHHIIDPHTGFPAENGLLSVSIVTPASMTADALSTSVFLLGPEKGMAFIERSPDTEAIFITVNHEIRVSSGLRGKLEILDKQYVLADAQ
jgi:thiamine biosynthesis lipoprotein